MDKCFWYIWKEEEGNEMGYTALEGTRIWLWDIPSGRRGVQRRGKHNGNLVMEHRDGIGERHKAMGIWY